MPPQPWPNPQMGKKEINEWKGKYEKWLKENTHLPNTIPADMILERMKNLPPPGPGGSPQAGPPQLAAGLARLEARINSIETNLAKLVDHLGVK